MAPPLNVVRQMLEAQMLFQIDPAKHGNNKGGPGTLLDNVADNVDFHIIGEGSDLDVHIKGVQAVQSLASPGSRPSLDKIIDSTKDVQTEVVHLIGSEESPWVAAVLRNIATTKAGKPFRHEWVVIMEFDNQNRISTLKTYPDSHLLHSHASDL
ncbi:hypothetical protein DL764_000378 [Monosporascus ibericus]|uniref:SnoaL-like domain-containing protein n=1 Tax=Monosporascus ibericus TaxID=155417 RepID=A0A4Q4TVM7_9PEZI|nr:hypothetical protein DL764_000378 [Monosporascus ibericus]